MLRSGVASGCAGLFAGLVFVIGSSAAQAIEFTDSMLQTTLAVNPAQSNINANIRVSASGFSDSDSDNSAISGTMDAKFGLDFSKGNLGITSLQFNGGDLSLDKNMHFDIDIVFIVTLFSADIDGVDLGGEPNTPSPSLISPMARPGVTGQFAASDHEIILNQGSINVTGDSNQSIALSSNPIAGASSSTTPGQVVIAQTAQDVMANTTTYSITVTTPIGVSEVIDSSGATITITGTGSVKASVADLVVNFLPWNGVFGDINQNGSLGPEDITAFVAGWRSTNDTPGLLAYEKGDLNFDGVTDLHDAFLLRSAFRQQNMNFEAGSLFASVNVVPEPSTVLLLTVGCLGLALRRRGG